MRNIIYFLLMLVLSSCMTVGRIQRNCDQFAKICVPETKTEIRYRDTLISLDPIQAKLPVSDINITMKFTVVDGVVNLPMQIRKNGLITTEVSIVNNELQVKSYLNDSTVLLKPDPVLLKDAIKEEKQTDLVPVKYIPKFYKFTFWLFILQAVMAAFWIFVSIKRLTFKSIVQHLFSFFK